MSGQSFINSVKVDNDLGGKAETASLELQMSRDLLTFRNSAVDIRWKWQMNIFKTLFLFMFRTMIFVAEKNHSSNANDGPLALWPKNNVWGCLLLWKIFSYKDL